MNPKLQKDMITSFPPTGRRVCIVCVNPSMAPSFKRLMVIEQRKLLEVGVMREDGELAGY